MIQAAHPGASIYLIYPKHLKKAYVTPKELLAKTKIFSGFIEYPFGDSFFERSLAMLKRLFLIPGLRAYRFAKVFHLEPSYKTASQLRRDTGFFRLAGIPRQVTTLEFRPSIPRDHPLPKIQHEVDFFVDALHQRGLPTFKPSIEAMDLCLDAEDDAEFRSWFAAQLGRPSKAMPNPPICAWLPLESVLKCNPNAGAQRATASLSDDSLRSTASAPSSSEGPKTLLQFKS